MKLRAVITSPIYCGTTFDQCSTESCTETMRAPRELNMSPKIYLQGVYSHQLDDLRDSIEKTGFLGQILDKIEI